jgi:hypothetical protein
MALTQDDIAAIRGLASRLQVDPASLGGLMELESNINPNIWGGAGGKYRGLIQFGPGARKEVGLPDRSMTVAEQIPYVERYFQQRGFQPGKHGVREMYRTVLVGNPHQSGTDSFGTNSDRAAARMAPGGDLYERALKKLGGPAGPSTAAAPAAPGPAPAVATGGGSRSFTDALVENLIGSTLPEMGMPGFRRQRSPRGGGSVGGDSLEHPRSFTDALVANLSRRTLGDFGAQVLGAGGFASGAEPRPRRMAGGMQAGGEAVPGLPDINSLVMSALFPSRAAAAQTTTAPAQQQAAMPTAALSGRRVSIVDAGKLLQQAGLRVREHPEFGGVGGHSKGSLHYSGRALDVTDWQDPGESEKSWKPRKAWMAQQIEAALKPYGAEVFGPHNDSEWHDKHIHIGLPSGSLPAEAAEQLQRIPAEGLKRYPLRWAG